MGPTRRRPESTEPTYPASEDATLSDDEWPVDERYVVQPDPVPGEEPRVEESPARRTTDDRSRSALVGLAFLVLALSLSLIAWIATRQDSGQASSSSHLPATPPATRQTTTSTHSATATTGARTISVPDVRGLWLSAARARLTRAGLRTRFRRVTANTPRNRVLAQSPAAATEASTASLVTLTVSKATRASVVSVHVPDVVGLSVSAARHTLASVELRAAGTQVQSNQPAHTVVHQAPRAGVSVRKGATVTISVSSGPAQITVPSVVGVDEQSARDRLEAAGFVVRVTDEPTTDPSQDGIVTGQDPAGGTRAAEGATIVLTVASTS